MNNGGQSYRWRQLSYYLEKICDLLLWLAPLALAMERLMMPLGDCDCLRSSIWPLVTLSLWAGGLLIYQLIFKSRFKTRQSIEAVRTIYLIFMIIALGVYLALVGEVTSLSVLALAAVLFNSLLYANFWLVFANMIGLELAMIFSGSLFVDGNAALVSMGLRNVLVLASVAYGLVLLILSLYNSDKNFSLQQEAKQTRQAAPVDNALTTLINNLNSGIIRLDNQLKISLYNASTLALLDTNTTLTAKRIEDVLVLKDLLGEVVDVQRMIRETTRVRVNDELIYKYKTGETIRLEVTISPIKNIYGVAEDDEYILILRDVTSAKNLEMERDEFISVISHELRTPIAIAEASLSNLGLMLDKKTEPVLLKNALKKSHEQILFLATMTNDLASLARADRAEILQFERLDLKTELHALFEKYQTAVEEKGLRFNLDVDPRIGELKTQRLYFEEILQNLLTNAIKYTETGEITLAAYYRPQMIEIAVIDTGIGIAKPDQAKIFEKFYRVEDYKTRQTGGTGLGLYVANKLALKIGGELKLKSRVGFGSTFSLCLPRSSKLKSRR